MPVKPKESNFPGVMLAHTWERTKTNPTNWLASEKLDGVRAIWNGISLVTRTAIKIPAPSWFTDGLPKDTMLDGELWMGRGRFQECSGAVRRERHTDAWDHIKYHIFDVPQCQHGSGLLSRLLHAKRLVNGIKHCSIVTQTRVESVPHLEQLFSDVVENGGEGLILRHPDYAWIPTRSHHMLKVKSDDECDAIVEGYLGGEGRHVGRVGALICRLRSIGKQHIIVHIGTGLSDADRESPPKSGSVVRCGHSGFTDSGVPRFPRFNGTRAEQGSV
jgi:DNA ligase-1